MSYHISMKATPRCDGSVLEYAVGTFAGGAELGRMVQLSVGNSYVDLTMDQVDELLDVLQAARHGSLESYRPPVTVKLRGSWLTDARRAISVDEGSNDHEHDLLLEVIDEISKPKETHERQHRVR